MENKINYVSKEMWKSIDKLEEDNAKPKFVREKFIGINEVLYKFKKN